MGIIYNVKKPREYNPTPVFHDPEKEALEERIEKIKREMGMESEQAYKQHIKGAMLDQTKHLKKRMENPEKWGKKKSMILIITLVILCILFYYFYIM